MKALFAAGGTGGHIYPALSIAHVLRARGDEVLFVGTRDRLESRLVPDAGYELFTIRAHPLSRRLSFDSLRTIALNAAGFFASLRLLNRVRPDIVIATGGYVCVPLVLAARIRRGFSRTRLPIALLERDALAGIADRVLAPLADDVWTAEATGVPVRATLLHLPPRAQALARLGLDARRKTLFAFGASQGARSINDAMIRLAGDRTLPEGWQILLLTGRAEYERVAEAIGDRARVLPYLDDPSDAYSAADLVLCRAGASTLAELQAARVPAILVPYPHATQAHQDANAAAAAENGSAVVIEDAALAERLAGLLAEVTQPACLERMRAAAPSGTRDATATIVARIDALLPRT